MASGYDIGFGLPTPDDVGSVLATSVGYLADLRARVQDKISEQTVSAVALRDSLHEQLQAQAALPVAKAQRVIDRIRGKASQALDQHIADVAVRLSPLGIEVPHASELVPAGLPQGAGSAGYSPSSGPCTGHIDRGKLPPDGDLSVWRVAWIGDPPTWISVQPGVEVPKGYCVAGWFRDEHTAVQAQVLGNEFAGMHEPLEEIVDYVYGISAGYVPPTQDASGSGSQGGSVHEAAASAQSLADDAPNSGALFTLWYVPEQPEGSRWIVLEDHKPAPTADSESVLAHVAYSRAMEQKYVASGTFPGSQPMTSSMTSTADSGVFQPAPGVGPSPLEQSLAIGTAPPPTTTLDTSRPCGWGVPFWMPAEDPDNPSGLCQFGNLFFSKQQYDEGVRPLFIGLASDLSAIDPNDRGPARLGWRSVSYRDQGMCLVVPRIPNEAPDPKTIAVYDTIQEALVSTRNYCGGSTGPAKPIIIPDPCAHPTYVYICNWPGGVTSPTSPSDGTQTTSPPQPPPQPPPGQPLPSVDTHWRPCDPDWCANLLSTLKQFDQFAEWLRSLLNDGPDRIEAWLQPTDFDQSYGGRLILVFINALLKLPGQFLQNALRQTYDNVNAVLQYVGGENYGTLFGLAAIRSILSSLHGRVGWNALLKAEINLAIDIPQAIERIDQLMHFVLPSRVPEVPEVLELYRRDLISEDHALCLARFHGRDSECFKKLLRAVQERLSVDELIEFQRRKDYDEQFVDDGMRVLGWTDPDTRDARKYLFDELPPITDLLHFAATNATNEEIIRRFGLGDEFERFWKEPLKPALSGQGVSEEWAKVHWQSHWVRPGVETAQAALRRLRPDQVDESIAFTEEDFDNVMRENDILPFWRERLKALAYNPPGIRFIKQLFELDVWGEDQTFQALQNINYSPEDARSLTDLYKIIKVRDQVKAAHGWDITTILKEYRDGLATEDQVRSILRILKYTDDQIDQSVAVAKTAIATEDRKHLLDALKHQYLTGLIEDGDLHDAITSTGVPIDRVQYLMTIWKAERQSKLHRGTISELRKYAIEGTISASELAQRLHVLGVSDDDIDRIYASISHEIQGIEEKKEAAAERRVQAAQEKKARQEQQAAKRAAARLARRLKAQAKIEAAQEKGDLGITLAQTPDKEEKARLRAEAGVEEAEDASELDAELPD